MKQVFVPLLFITLSACSEFDPSELGQLPAMEELINNPERLKELQAQCKTNRHSLDDALCSRVAEAARKQFYGDGNVPYTPSATPPNF